MVSLSKKKKLYCVGLSDDSSDEGNAFTLNKKKKKVAAPAGKRVKSSSDPPTYSHWLMKSEPESRFENGIDMKVQIGFRFSFI